MGTKSIITLSVIVILILFSLIVGLTYVSLSNTEIKLRNTIETKQQDNQNEFDNLWKKIKQTAPIPDKERKSLLELITSNAQARSETGDGQLMTWVQESVPKASPELYGKLMNIITGSRDAWTQRQKELLDLSRQHTNSITTFPGSLFLGGREKIKITIITSDKTEETFSSGKDNDISLD